MPELPEVETVARDLARLVGGSMIRGGRIIRAANLSTPDPETFARAIADRRIEGVRRRAKWVLIDLEGGLILMVHLRMTGQLIVLPESSAPDAYVRAELLLSDRRVIRFRDVRAFGRLALVARRGDGSPSRSLDPLDEPALSGHGPEPLEATFTVSKFASDLQRRRGRLKSLLLDQRFIAGLGNIYADEALWRARLHPLATAATLRVAEVERLHSAIVALLSEAVAARGSSIDDYTGPDGDGAMQERLAVYQRGGEPCLRCGSTIRRVMLGGRGTHFCPRCQPMPRGQRAAGSSGSLTPTASPRRGPRWSEALSEGSAGATSAERAAARRRAVRTGGVQ
ncbi:MAG: bifunctional DNA-formamidopyrimidine glycosylase/DNA-(apurinic or apyrimidinic site) lyase [Candidatus Limnocylindrus sp.]